MIMMKDLYKKYFFWFFLGLSFLVLFSFVQNFPAKSFILSGDIYTPIFGKEFFTSSLFETEGRGFLWYGFFWLTDSLSLNHSITLSLYLTFFFLLSYGSFWWLARKFSPLASPFVLFAFSFLYAFNIFVGMLFISGKLFSPLGLLYSIFPFLVGGYWRFFQKPTLERALFFLLFFFIAGTAFIFPLVAVVIGVFFCLYTGVLWIFSSRKYSWKFVLKLLSLWLGVLLVNAYTLWSLCIRFFYGEGVLLPNSGGNQGVVLENAQEISSSLINAFRLIETHFSFFEGISFFGVFFILISFLPLVWIFFGWIVQKRQREKRIFWIFLTLFLCLSLLYTGLSGIGGFLYQKVFIFPEKNIFLTGEIFSLFLPFLGIFLGLLVSQFEHISRKTFAVSAIILSLSASPFFFSLYENNEKEERQSIVILEEDYVSLWRYNKEFLNDTDGSMAIFPYREEESSFEKNILPALLQREIISSHDPYFEKWSHTKTFSQSTENPQWITSLLGVSQTRYILWNKKSSNADSEKEEFLVSKKVLENILETKTFTLYRIADDFVFPLFFVSEKSFALVENPSRILALQEEMKKKYSTEIPYTKSFGKYMLFVDETYSGKDLIFARPFHPFWEAKFIQENESRETITHIRSLGLLNGWELPKFSGKAKVEIVFVPMKFFVVSLYITGIAVLCSILGKIGLYMKKKLYEK